MNLGEYRQAVIDGVMCLYCGANNGVPCRQYSVSHFAHIYLDYVHDNRSVAYHNQSVAAAKAAIADLEAHNDMLVRDLDTLRKHAARLRIKLRSANMRVKNMLDHVLSVTPEPELETDKRRNNDEEDEDLF